MRPTAETQRSRRRRHTAPPTEASKEQHESEVASIETGLNLLKVYTSALEELKERGQSAASDIKLALELRHAPRDWSNTEILSVMADIIDEHPKPKLEFVLGVLGLSKVPENLDDRLRSKGAKAYSSSVRNRALRKKKEAKEKEERERREKKEREERERRERKEREEKQKLEKERLEKERLEKERLEKERLEKERLEKERLEKERLEKERLEKERLEKERLEKERLEKERLEKERLEKERIEKERIEKERLEREKAEEEKKNAALKKEAEAKKGNGKVRKGRRSRPPTRVMATEKAKKADGDQMIPPKVLMQQSSHKAKNFDAMELHGKGVKHDTVAEKMSSMDLQEEAVQRNVISGGPNVDTETLNSAMSTEPAQSAPPASLPRSSVRNATRHAKSFETKGKQAGGTPKEEQRQSRDGDKTGSKPVTFANQTVDQPESGAKKIQPKKPLAKTEGVKMQVDRNHKAPAVHMGTRGHPNAIKVGPRHEESKMLTRSRPENVRDDDRKAPKPVLRDPPTEDKPRAADAQVRQPIAVHAPASNKVVVEAKITSALKESAAAVNREMPECHLNSSVPLKPFSVVEEGSSAKRLQVPGEREVAAVQKTVDEEMTLEPASVGNLTGTATDSKESPTGAKEPIPQRPALETLKESRAVDEKVKAIDSAKKSVDESIRKEGDSGATGLQSKATQPTEVVTERATKEKESQDNTGDRSASPVESDISKDIVEEAMPDDATRTADSQEKEKEPEQEAEDFMADVFGPEDGDVEKDDTEEGDGEKRGLRYRTRGRRSDDDDEGEAHALTDKGSLFVVSEDESESKDTHKRARSTGAPRRTSRRVSNIRDEIVIAPTGRRMRRESRNLINRAWQLPNTDQYLLECVEVWERLHGNRITIPFREPVTAKDAPGYFDIVKNPMDMGTVKNMLQDGRISSPEGFYKQMKLICSNAFLFNDEDSDLYELASELLEMIRKDTKPIVKAWRQSRGLDPDESESESEPESHRKRTKGRGKKKASKSKSKTKSKSATERRKRGREDDGGGKSKKRRTSRRSARREDEE